MLHGEPSGTGHPLKIGVKLYWYKFGGEIVEGSSISSGMDVNGNCSAVSNGFFALMKAISNEDSGNALVEAREITEPSYEGPLFIN